jgi:hypothetical protein
MSARVHVSARRESHRFAGFHQGRTETPEVSVSVSFDLGKGDDALSVLRSAVAEAEADIRRASGAAS